MSARLPCFKTYDIRGTVPDQVNPALLYQVARCVKPWLGVNEVIVGRDTRLSSPSLAEAIVKGLVESGVSVWDIGLATTPMLNFAAATRKRHGLMITASHNPKQYNGVKFVNPAAEQIYYEKGLAALEALVTQDRSRPSVQRGRVVIAPILHDYVEDLVGRFQGKIDAGSFSVVVDCSNGVGGLPLEVLDRLGIRHTLLNHVPDGNFPNHGCDTLQPENLQQLQAAVKRDGADLGIMFDGDADRVMFVDEMGTITPVDLMFVLLAREALSQRKGRVFYDLRFSRSVKDEITALGGEPVTLRVGNPFYKEALHQHADGLLAAELSGHIMYKDRFGIDDAFYAALKLISYLTTSKQPLSQQIAEIRRYTGSGELRIETDDPQALVDKAKATHAAAAISELDGVTVEYSDWWFNLRPSNTEPIAKLVIEADSPGSLERRKAELLGQLS